MITMDMSCLVTLGQDILLNLHMHQLPLYHILRVRDKFILMSVLELTLDPDGLSWLVNFRLVSRAINGCVKVHVEVS